MKYKEPSSIQKFARKRNWAKFQVVSIRQQTISLMNNSSVDKGEKLILDSIKINTSILLKHWKEV